MYYLKINFLSVMLVVITLSVMQGCASVSTFPTIARAGDTISVMAGGSEKVKKETISIVLTDANGVDWDLAALGKIRSVFNLRTDARATGMHYSSYLESNLSWNYGHEPVQTVVVADIPASVAVGNAVLAIDTLVDDDSSEAVMPLQVNVEIIPGTGQSDNFMRKDFAFGEQAVDFSRLETAPNVKISFGQGSELIGAASLVVDFDESVVNGNDINIYVPESYVRGALFETGKFGDHQRMVYWRHDGQQLFIDIVAPQGIKQDYLMLYILYPASITGSPGLNLLVTDVYDVNGNVLGLAPVLVAP